MRPLAGPRAGGLVSRVLSASTRGWRRLAIYLGRASPRASSGQPGDLDEPGRLSLPIGPCTGWGLPSCPCYQGHWCALTAPFHPYARGAEAARARSAFCCTCRRLTRPAVSWHPALRCPDFPRRACTLAPSAEPGRSQGNRRRAHVAARPPTQPPSSVAEPTSTKPSAQDRSHALGLEPGPKPGLTAGGSRLRRCRRR